VDVPEMEIETLWVLMEVRKPFTGTFQELANQRNAFHEIMQIYGYFHRN
jgi:hypothetical protein